MLEDQLTALETEQPDQQTDDEIQAQIIALFERLPTYRQSGLSRALVAIYELVIDDDDDDDDDDMPY